MRTTLVLPGHIADRVRNLACSEVETGGVLLASLVRTPAGDVRLLATELHEVPDDAYERREVQQLLIRSHGYVPALARAEEQHALPIWFHTHPGDGSSPRKSKHDKIVDSQLSDLFRLRADSDYYGALIISTDGNDLNFTGHLDDGDSITIIDRLWVVGPRLALRSNCELKRASLPGLFDRNIRAFGGDVQRVLSDLTVAVIGCGGTGSVVAEQLVRLGVRRFLLVDSDTLSETNVTRVYGSTPADVGRRKVDVLGDHLSRVAPDVEVQRIASMINVERTARELVGADVVFGCTDDNAGRLILSRLSTFMLVPVIDCGVLLSSDDDDHLVGIDGRVTILYPGAACLVCRGRVDLARAASEMLTPAERIKRVEEGYAPALHGIEPAVVTFTTLVGGTAAAELVERLTHYGDEPVPSEVLLRLHDREISTNGQEPRSRHYCDVTAGKLGLGDTRPFLGQTWSA